jgi:hypothetical protein
MGTRALARRQETKEEGTLSSVAGQARAVSIWDGGALVSDAGHRMSHSWRCLVALAVAAVVSLAMVAQLTLATAPLRRAHPSAAHSGPQSHPTASLPAGLAAVASSSIGASERNFWPARHGASLSTRGGGIHSTFTATGARLRVAQGSLGLRLAAVERGPRVERIAPVAPQRAGDQVLYRYGTLIEFYRDGPYGLEQGFMLPQRPNAGTGSLVLTVSIGGSLLPRQVGSQVLFTTPGGVTALRYGQLNALDATGRRLPVYLRIHTRSLQLQIDDSHARYPLRIDPFIRQGEELVAKSPAEEIGKGEFGASVALDSKGETALIGGPRDNNNVGATWVFTRSGPTWTQQEKLVAKSGEEIGAGGFGDSVALDSKGETALIGSGCDGNVTPKFECIGAAWVFKRESGKFVQQGTKLVAKSGEEIGAGRFGASVALSSEGGNTALIGGPLDSTNVGAAWVFTRASETWTQQGAKLTAKSPEEIGEGEFGASVALDSEKGNIALIGGPMDNTRVGAAWVFTRASETWTQQGAKLVAKSPEEIGEGEFGTSVALSAEKASPATALIGGVGDNEGVGAAWVFTRNSETWTQQGEKLVAKLKEEIGAGLFGESVALSSKGEAALIGGPGDKESIGAAWVFKRESEKWTQRGEKLTPIQKEEIGKGQFGASVALSSEAGSIALVGGPGDKENIGAAWAFANQAAPPAVATNPASEVTATSATLNATVNPNGQSVTKCEFEYGPTETYGSAVPCKELPGSGEFRIAVSASVTGLTNIVYHFRISATNATGTSKGNDRRLVATAPTGETKPATEVTSTTATLNATVNSHGGEISKCEFEYGESEAYGFRVSCTSLPPPGESAVAVSASVGALNPNTTYHFRISATSTGGTSKGADETFKTLPKPPTVLTGAASSVTLTSATLNATVNPNGAAVSECKFEYGTTVPYGSSATCTPAPGSGSSPVAVSASLTGLTAHTIYHFRISATNAGGTSTGSDRTFATAPPHYYREGVLVGSAPKTDIAWGTVKLVTVKGEVIGSAVTCHSASAGTLFNPVGGGAGEGLTEAFATFNCESKGICLAGQSTAVVAEGLPWHNILTEEVLGTIRQEATGVKALIECLVGGKVESEQRFLTRPGAEGLRPSSNMGTSALHPSFFEYGAGSGELELEASGGAVTRKVEGAVKVLGFEAQELITVK